MPALLAGLLRGLLAAAPCVIDFPGEAGKLQREPSRCGEVRLAGEKSAHEDAPRIDDLDSAQYLSTPDINSSRRIQGAELFSSFRCMILSIAL